MSKYLTTVAITLRRNPRGEDDRMYTLYTSAVGLVETVADGSQKILSKLAGHLEPFGEVLVTLVRRGQAYKLSGAVARRRYRHVFASLPAMRAAGECLRFTREMIGSGHPDLATYALLRGVLEELDAPLAEVAAEAASTVYALKLLAQLGFQPQLARCGRCQAAVLEGAFDVVAGSLRCLRCAKSNAGTLVRLNTAATSYLREALAQPLPHALRLPVTAPTFEVARQLVTQFAEYHTDASRPLPTDRVLLS